MNDNGKLKRRNEVELKLEHVTVVIKNEHNFKVPKPDKIL